MIIYIHRRQPRFSPSNKTRELTGTPEFVASIYPQPCKRTEAALKNTQIFRIFDVLSNRIKYLSLLK